jgi:glycosyltransferase involved in cell wall biosynthesis
MYRDEPWRVRTRLLFTAFPERCRDVIADAVVMFPATSHRRWDREQILRFGRVLGFEESALVRVPTQEEVSGFEAGIARADKVAVIGNDCVADTYRRHGVSESKLVTLNCGVDHALYVSQPRTDSRATFLFPSPGMTVRKGLPFLLAAWRRIVNQTDTSRIRLILAGSGNSDISPEAWSDVAAIEATGAYVAGSPGHLELLNSAHYVVFPSLSEGQAGTLLEAMSCGCVPIATRESGIDADRYGGWVVEAGNAEQLAATLFEVIRAHSPAAWSARSAQARARIVAEHSWADFQDRIRHVCAEFVTQRNSPP